MRKSLLQVLLLLICIALLSACASIHIPLKEDEVIDVIVYDSKYDSTAYHQMTQEEISNLIGWFNDCTDVCLNSNFAGEGSIVGITITTNDREITISDSGEDFEIQVYTPEKNETISYWAKQKDIETLLESINKPIEEE